MVDKGRYTGFKGFDPTEVVGYVRVLWSEAAAEHGPGFDHVLAERPIHRDASQETLPDVPMTIDQSWENDLASRVDLLCSRRTQPRTDGRDPIPFDMDVRHGRLRRLEVHRHDQAATDDLVIRHVPSSAFQ